MKTLGKIAGLLLTTFLAGCESVPRQISNGPHSRPLSANDGIYVMLAPDAGNNGKIQQGSGLAACSALASAFRNFSGRVLVGAKPESLDSARDVAVKQGLSVVVQPDILDWQDNPTNWTGERDRITIRATAWEANSGALIGDSTARSQSPSLALEDEGPDRLLSAPLNELAQGFYR